MTGDQQAPPPADRELDCRGMPCPRPIIELARHIGQVAVGDTLTVVAEDPAAAADVAAWCRMRGQEFLGAGLAPDGVPSYTVRRLA